MYPTDDQSNGRVGMPVSDQRRSLTPPTRDSAASRNAAADVIRGQLDAIYSRSEEQNSALVQSQAQPFLTLTILPLNCEFRRAVRSSEEVQGTSPPLLSILTTAPPGPS
ncbi:hypothetical protein KOY49_01785 [Candidatus Minimicrobia vallesae]|uniref:Uncharacterized protein n=1 Tax=Candidatus Minimicrobia vallesae TaxID=2841264 RepID=A0A8F1MAD1_9BACT|nr:hypothetical protein [Candidatus Minimicrobia vallesae]QWQ31717.1 hypothetical protein KOY49_01785 [Candidatus Minimicrobia vallesae]